MENKDSWRRFQRALFATNARVGLVSPVLAAEKKMAIIIMMIFGNVKFAPIVQGDHEQAVAPVRLSESHAVALVRQCIVGAISVATRTFRWARRISGTGAVQAVQVPRLVLSST